ncbi:hypothetical protein FB451DRAFT_1417465 [Mycena latifolia]|nr:hypothetical protein FB451DRAFT_1417465 [Mycena latifolia]
MKLEPMGVFVRAGRIFEKRGLYVSLSWRRSQRRERVVLMESEPGLACLSSIALVAREELRTGGNGSAVLATLESRVPLEGLMVHTFTPAPARRETLSAFIPFPGFVTPLLVSAERSPRSQHSGVLAFGRRRFPIRERSTLALLPEAHTSKKTVSATPDRRSPAIRQTEQRQTPDYGWLKIPARIGEPSFVPPTEIRHSAPTSPTCPRPKYHLPCRDAESASYLRLLLPHHDPIRPPSHHCRLHTTMALATFTSLALSLPALCPLSAHAAANGMDMSMDDGMTSPAAP